MWAVGEKYPVWMSHGDRVTELPPGFRTVATSPNAPIAIIADDARKFYATYFHVVYTLPRILVWGCGSGTRRSLSPLPMIRSSRLARFASSLVRGQEEI